jgi:hypothetical protein
MAGGSVNGVKFDYVLELKKRKGQNMVKYLIFNSNHDRHGGSWDFDKSFDQIEDAIKYGTIPLTPSTPCGPGMDKSLLSLLESLSRLIC